MAEIEIPDIPGLDGRPLDFPRFVKLKDGYQITCDATKVQDATPPSKPRLAKPQKRTRSLAGKPFNAGSGLGVTLTLDARTSESYAYAPPMVFSERGDWLYVVDGQSTLRKIRSSDLTETAHLVIGGFCRDMSFSKEGLVVANATDNAVWVIHPESLQVLRTIPVRGVEKVIGSPGTNIAFATGRGGERGTSPFLVMMDVAKGRALHRWKSDYGSRSLFVGQHRLFERFWQGSQLMYISGDGKRFFMGAMDIIERFRIDGETLVFETAVPLETVCITDKYVASRKRKIMRLFDPQDLESQKSEFDVGPIGGRTAFDPKTGKIYIAGYEKMVVYDPKAKESIEFYMPERGAKKIAMHPQGERIAVWRDKTIVYLDTKPDRLRQLLEKNDTPE